MTRFGEWRPVWFVPLIRLFAGDDCGSLWWKMVGGDYRFFVDCSDTFWWATADAEPVTVEDLPGLERAKMDLPDGDWPVLWCARKRGLRPMRRYLETLSEGERVLFEGVGPVRDPASEG